VARLESVSADPAWLLDCYHHPLRRVHVRRGEVNEKTWRGCADERPELHRNVSGHKSVLVRVGTAAAWLRTPQHTAGIVSVPLLYSTFARTAPLLNMLPALAII